MGPPSAYRSVEAVEGVGHSLTCRTVNAPIHTEKASSRSRGNQGSRRRPRAVCLVHLPVKCCGVEAEEVRIAKTEISFDSAEDEEAFIGSSSRRVSPGRGSCERQAEAVVETGPLARDDVQLVEVVKGASGPEAGRTRQHSAAPKHQQPAPPRPRHAEEAPRRHGCACTDDADLVPGPGKQIEAVHVPTLARCINPPHDE
mmetsp:Transcript_14033/g.29937  ORF Transcript_14033/g.29937 Transcript_14033/m.29937 type:complete len:200 (-) Transcript_14033:953-1552(-)